VVEFLGLIGDCAKSLFIFNRGMGQRPSESEAAG